MKILVPYKQLDNVSITSDDVKGGIEIFTKRLVENTDHEVVVVEYTASDSARRRTQRKIMDAIEMHKPDVLVCNFATMTYTYNIIDDIDIPIVWIFHSLGDTVQSIGFAKVFDDFRSRGNSIFMVSEYQHETWKGMAKRNKISECLEVDGYIQSAFNVFSDEPLNKEFDAITISRPTRGKDGYFLNTHLKDVVDKPKAVLVTTDSNDADDRKYIDSSLRKGTNIDIRVDISRAETLDILKKSKVYVSPSFRESWGITTLEALCYGIPVLAAVDSNDKGPIHGIPADASHYDTFKKGDSIESIIDKIKKLGEISEKDRHEIMILNREKHSKDAWIKSFNKILEDSIEKYKKCPKKELTRLPFDI